MSTRAPVRGLLVTVEGGEGAGKSTLVAMLAGRAHEAGVDVVACREPGGTALGERLRAALLDDDRVTTGPAPEAELLLFAAARAQLVAEVLRPALASGSLVICDRYQDSTVAYQHGGRGLDRALVAAVNRAATGGLSPDLTLLLDISPAAGLARAGSAGDYMEREAIAFHERVGACYRELAAEEPQRWLVLDARDPPALLAERAWQRIGRVLPASRPQARGR